MAEVRDFTDWASFICAACGRRTLYGVEPVPGGLEDVESVVAMIFGTPPVCTECQNAARDLDSASLNREQRRRLRHTARARRRR